MASAATQDRPIANAKHIESYDRAEFQRRMDVLVPKVRERAAEAEELRRLPPSTFNELLESKLLRVAQPPKFGGVGLDMDEVYELGFQLARADPSQGWNASFYALHAHQIGMFPLETQQEYWADSYDVQMVTASGVVRAEFEDKGDQVLVNGEWDFASGLDQADWILLSRLVDGGARQMLIPKSHFEIVDNWYTAGARATGSKRVRVTNALIPPHFMLDGAAIANGKTKGRELHPSPYYKLPIFPWMGYVISMNIVGAAQGMIDAFVQGAPRRFEMTTGDKFVERAANQLRVAEAAAEINAARQVHAADVRLFHQWAEADYEPTLLERAEVRRNAGYVVKLAQQATNRLFDVSGASSIYNTSPLQRHFRDVNVMAHSIAVVWDPIAEQYGQILWGLTPKSYNL
jgi:alkylation response protein AidB-like acyl-CoA dehydrogenase